MMAFTESRRVRRTKKPHRCCWCAEPIPAGSSVWRDTAANEQGLFSGYWHDECYAAASRMSTSDREDCYDGWDAGDFDRGMTPSETGAKRRVSE
jgi:hypothetical protein